MNVNNITGYGQHESLSFLAMLAYNNIARKVGHT